MDCTPSTFNYLQAIIQLAIISPGDVYSFYSVLSTQEANASKVL